MPSGDKQIIVTQTSACDIGFGNNATNEYPLYRNHSGLVKFTGSSDQDYEMVSEKIQSVVASAMERGSQRHRKRNNQNLSQYSTYALSFFLASGIVAELSNRSLDGRIPQEQSIHRS